MSVIRTSKVSVPPAVRELRVGGVGECAVRMDLHLPVLRIAGHGVAQRITFGVLGDLVAGHDAIDVLIVLPGVIGDDRALVEYERVELTPRPLEQSQQQWRLCRRRREPTPPLAAS